MPSSSAADSPYPEVGQAPDFPALERSILDFWAADGTFQASVDQRPAGDNGDNEYVFYDGPPFANGLPHHGHLLTGYVKDAVPRYQTMRGRRVERRFGWDCHGLPAEMLAEKELGISGHAAITAYGVEKFNDYCAQSVLRFTSEWRSYVTRQARWVDFDNDYKTMDPDFMESTLWAFSQLYAKGLIYEGYRVLPYCTECETPLSNFETRFDDSTRERQDPALTVMFTLDPAGDDSADEPVTKLLVWTTTPWTLPSNLAVAVGPDIDYAVLEEDGVRYVLGEATVATYASELEAATPVTTIKGAELVGRTYTPLFPYFAGHPQSFRVLAADFVDTGEGTGIVHMAPGFGEEDQRTCEANGITVVCPVDDQGRFTAEVTDYVGQHVFDANPEVIRDLKAAGRVVRHETIEHNYPHCWRTRNPLIYRAVSSWFVKVTAIKDRMLELNQEIDWRPAYIRDGLFGNWVDNARDWSISRTRFWGAPIPVWKSDDPAYPRVDVYGSVAALARDFGGEPEDLHRPAIDALTRPNPDDPTGKSTMRRVPEVLDCWFESGSMPFGQVHYPFENAASPTTAMRTTNEWFEQHFPADFIVEYVAQYRAWFFYLLVMSTALFDRIPFRRCLVHGVILGDDGRKASKSLGNYVDPEAVFDKQGADALRWYLLSSAVLRGQDIIVDDRGITETVRNVLNPVWSAWYFFSLYANTDGVRATTRADATGVLDRYVLAKGHDLVTDVTARMDESDLAGACAAIAAFIDALNNWYIRRSRDRFWTAERTQDKTDAYDTLFTVLEVLSRVAAPLLPMLAESVWKGLTGQRSVHLADWPEADALPADPELVADMDLVREVCSAALSVRKANQRRVRLPLATLTVAAPDAERLRPFIGLIADEVNVKDVVLTDEVESLGTRVLSVVPAVVGPRLGPAVQQVLGAARKGEWEAGPGDTVVVAGHQLDPGEFTLRLTPRDEATARALPGDAGLVVLDIAVTPELEDEGLARDVVRCVNVARRDAGLHVADRIRLWVTGPDDVTGAVRRHQQTVADDVLAVELSFDGAPADAHTTETEMEGRTIRVGIVRV